jgi:hypothetical protein
MNRGFVLAVIALCGLAMFLWLGGVATPDGSGNSSGRIENGQKESGGDMLAAGEVERAAGPVNDSWPSRLPKHYHAERMQQDRNYRLIMTEYQLQRDVKALRSSETNFARLFSLIVDHGVELALANEMARMAYEDVAAVQTLESLAHEEDAHLEKAMAKLHAVGLPAPEKTKRNEHLQLHFEHVKSMWMYNSEELKKHATGRMIRETGITNHNFYEELFSIKFAEGARPLPEFTEDEEVFR